MGGEKLASFFVKIQAVEESFLQLDVKERSRALNILQSSINKLLNFVGDADIVSAGLAIPVPDNFLSKLENTSKETQCSYSEELTSSSIQVKRPALSGVRKRKNVNRQKKNKYQKDNSLFCNSSRLDSSETDSSFSAETANLQTSNACKANTVQQPVACKGKQERKDSFDDDLQELANFDYDFNPNLQATSTNNVSRAGNSHMTQCRNKFTGKMLSMSSATSEGNPCPVSGAQSAYPEQVIDVAASHEGGHAHYGGQLLPSAAAEMETSCHLSQAPQYATQIIACSQIENGTETSQYATGVVDSSGDPSQYAGGVIDTSGDPSQYAGTAMDSGADPSQYAGGVMDASGNPSQYAGGVLDSNGDPSQYAGNVIDSSGETSQYAGGVMDTSGEAPQYGGGVIEMSEGQEAQLCNPAHVHAHYTGAMIPTAQDVTVCTTTQYPGTVLAMSVPETISYSAAHYSHAIMQGLNCAPSHPQFSNTVLDMSTVAGRQSEIGFAASHSSSQYAGTIFEGTVIGAQTGAVCSPFQFRRPMFEPHEAFQRSQELTFMHASMLQQQQLYQLQQQAMTSRWRVFVCKACGETLTHYRSIIAHLMTHGSSPLSCRCCRQRLVNDVALLHHLCGGQQWKQSAKVSQEMFMCRECGKFFTTRSKLKDHMEIEHQSVMPKDIKCTCRFCGLQLSKKMSLFCHYRQHAGGRFVCCLCGAFLNDFVQYASHMAVHYKRKKKQTCMLCSQVFATRHKFAEHVKTHSSFPCSRCQQDFTSHDALSTHQVKVHNSDNIKVKAKTTTIRSQRQQCGICHKQFSKAKDLKLHIHIHAGEKLLDCTTCKMRFQSKRALGKHRRTQGHCQRLGKSQEAQHLCSECGKAYHRRQALHRHLRQHQSAKPFSCKFCNFRCSAKDNLRRHEAHHFATQRNFICELCGAAFHAKKTLEMHHSYKHNAERRFKCSECPMTFKARNALNRHSKTHSRSREHGCWCGAAFNRLYNLRRHMRLVHGSDEALPPLRKVEVLDTNQSVKQAASTPPAKKMLVKSRKVKADCMQEEQEAAAAVVVVGGEDGEGGGDGGSSRMEREEGQVLPQVGMTSLLGSNQQPSLQNVNYSAMSAASAGGVVAQANLVHPFSHPHPHLTMEQSYAMVSATLHHHHHHNLHHDPQQTIIASTGGETSSIPPHPFPHLSHPSLDYSQLPNLSSVVPYCTNLTSTNSAATTSAANVASRQDYFAGPGGGGIDGVQQPATDYTTSPFSFIQNFLLPSVGVANLLDLAHASGAK